jgi:putative membrane protein
MFATMGLFAQDLPATGSQRQQQDSGNNASEMTRSIRDRMFLRNAIEGGMAEIQLGRLAAQKGSEEVKAFWQKMVDDHTAINSDLAALADSLGVRLPKTLTKEDQAEYDKLSGLSGNEFDTEYLTVMVKTHHADFHAFRLEASDAEDPGLQNAVVKALKVIRQHTIMVDKLARSKGISVPSHGSQPA